MYSAVAMQCSVSICDSLQLGQDAIVVFGMAFLVCNLDPSVSDTTCWRDLPLSVASSGQSQVQQVALLFSAIGRHIPSLCY